MDKQELGYWIRSIFFGVVDIVPFELKAMDENNLKVSMKEVLQGSGGIKKKDKRRTQRYINYGVGTRCQGKMMAYY